MWELLVKLYLIWYVAIPVLSFVIGILIYGIVGLLSLFVWLSAKMNKSTPEALPRPEHTKKPPAPDEEEAKTARLETFRADLQRIADEPTESMKETPEPRRIPDDIHIRKLKSKSTPRRRKPGVKKTKLSDS